MFCFRKNKEQRSFTGGIILVAIIGSLFIIIAAQSGQGTRTKENDPSETRYKEAYGANGIKKAFDRLDINCDGCLTAADYEPDRSQLALLAIIPYYREIVPAMVSKSRKKWNKYARLDTNGDGRVDFKEFIAPRRNLYRRVQPK